MTSTTTARPDAAEYPAAVKNYIRLVPDGDLRDFLAVQAEEFVTLVGPLDDAQALVKHAPYTWTIKQVVGHMADCERVFGYRAMRLSRHDTTPLPGFDENAYMAAIDFDRLPLGDLLAEFESQRRSNVLLLRHLDAEAWRRVGTINLHPMTVRAVAYVMAGHAAHHLAILHTRLER